MKNFTLLSFFAAITALFCLQYPARSQGFVNNVYFLPPNPTEQDIIKIVGDVSISNGSCPLMMITCSETTPGTIEVNAYHCFGMLPYICNASDTCTIGQLAAGIYGVTFYLWTSFCPNPSFVNSGYGYNTLTVSPTVTGKDRNTNRDELTICPNPAHEKITVFNNGAEKEMFIYSPDGRLAEKHFLENGSNEIVLNLAPGVYQAVIAEQNIPQKSVRLSVIR